MRLLIDAQCIQSTSSLRGIGRYALALTQALVAEAGEHQVEVLLNSGDDPSRLHRARAALESFLPPRRVHVFDAAWSWSPPYDDARRPAAEAAYGAAIRSIAPDAVLVGSVFEGDTENVMTVGRLPSDPPTAAVLYDLIPALAPETYLLGPGAAIYWRRLNDLKRCNALLAISGYSGGQAQQLLGADCPPVTPVWGGPYPSGAFPAFEPAVDDAAIAIPLRFLLSVGGDHPRKNLDRLVLAWGSVPPALRAGTPLLIACRLNPGTRRRLRRLARRSGLAADEVLLAGGVSEKTLHSLYSRALAFVFPSTEEGLGMPPLEAMAANCPTILARGSSLSELANDPEAFFDGHDVADMTRAMARVLADGPYRERLRGIAGVSAERFTWQRAARLAWTALEQIAATPAPAARSQVIPVALSDTAAIAALAERPGPVRVDMRLEPAEPGLFGLPLRHRLDLAPATALLVADQVAASEVVRAGLLDMAVRIEPADADRLARHDFHAAYAAGLACLPPTGTALLESVVAAVERAPRWTLERPRPVWLLVGTAPALSELVALCDEAGVDLVAVRPEGVGLAASADVALVAANDLADLESSLGDARRRGAVVVVLHPPGSSVRAPAWAEAVQLDGPMTSPESWRGALLSRAASWGRTTGWPWREQD